MSQNFCLFTLLVFLDFHSCLSVLLPTSYEDKTLRPSWARYENVERTTNASECFDVYLPELQNATDQWSASYEECLTQAGNQRVLLTQQIEEDKEEIIESSNAICDYINNCQAFNDELDFFKCFSNLSEISFNNIYEISKNASDDTLLLTEEYQGIDSTMYRCTNASQRAYVQQTAKIYHALDKCLNYGLTSDEGTTETTLRDSETVTRNLVIVDGQSSKENP